MVYQRQFFDMASSWKEILNTNYSIQDLLSLAVAIYSRYDAAIVLNKLLMVFNIVTMYKATLLVP